MSNTPSDAEIEKLAAEHLKAFSQFPMGGQVWFEGEVEFARAVLAKWGTQPQAGAVPQRWKAVPVNPTPEMWKAAKTVPDPNPPYPPHYGLVWDAMLAASPTPPVEQAAPKAAPGDAIDEAMRERDDAEDFIDALLDEVLGHERPEWSNLYGRADALNDVQERMTSLHKPAVDKAWGQFQSAMAAPQPAPAPLSEMPYEKRKAIQEGEQIGASDAWFKARHEMLDTVDRRNVFRAGFDRGWNAALDAQGGK